MQVLAQNSLSRGKEVESWIEQVPVGIPNNSSLYHWDDPSISNVPKRAENKIAWIMSQQERAGWKHQRPVVMAVGCVLAVGQVLLSFSLLFSWFVDADSPKHSGNGQACCRDIFLQFVNISSQEFKLNSLVDLTRAGGHFVSWPRKKFLKSRVAYSVNCTASFNPTEIVIVRSGDVHPLPGPNTQTNTAKLDIPKELKSNIKAAHLNVRSLKYFKCPEKKKTPSLGTRYFEFNIQQQDVRKSGLLQCPEERQLKTQTGK